MTSIDFHADKMREQDRKPRTDEPVTSAEQGELSFVLVTIGIIIQKGSETEFRMTAAGRVNTTFRQLHSGPLTRMRFRISEEFSLMQRKALSVISYCLGERKRDLKQ